MGRQRRKTFPAIADLSRAAYAIMEAAFLQGPGVRSVKSIVEEIKEKTGERIDDNAIYRYREYWLSEERPFIEGRRQADAMLAALKDSPGADLEELVRQRLTYAQVLSAKQLEGADPVELGYLMAAEKRIDIQKERNAILKQRTAHEKEKIGLLERTVALREEQLKRAKEKAEGAAKSIEALGKRKGLDAETLKKIREEVYGIVEAPV